MGEIYLWIERSRKVIIPDYGQIDISEDNIYLEKLTSDNSSCLYNPKSQYYNDNGKYKLELIQ
jgi:hypothetical protein